MSNSDVVVLKYFIDPLSNHEFSNLNLTHEGKHTINLFDKEKQQFLKMKKKYLDNSLYFVIHFSNKNLVGNGYPFSGIKNIINKNIKNIEISLHPQLLDFFTLETIRIGKHNDETEDDELSLTLSENYLVTTDISPVCLENVNPIFYRINNHNTTIHKLDTQLNRVVLLARTKYPGYISNFIFSQPFIEIRFTFHSHNKESDELSLTETNMSQQNSHSQHRQQKKHIHKIHINKEKLMKRHKYVNYLIHKQRHLHLKP